MKVLVELKWINGRLYLQGVNSLELYLGRVIQTNQFEWGIMVNCVGRTDDIFSTEADAMKYLERLWITVCNKPPKPKIQELPENQIGNLII